MTTPTTDTNALRRIDLYAATTTKRDLRNYIIEWEQEYNQLAEAYIAQGLDLAASREREARLREALRRSDELDTIDEGYGEIAGIARAALTETEATR